MLITACKLILIGSMWITPCSVTRLVELVEYNKPIGCMVHYKEESFLIEGTNCKYIANLINGGIK